MLLILKELMTNSQKHRNKSRWERKNNREREKKNNERNEKSRVPQSGMSSIA